MADGSAKDAPQDPRTIYLEDEYEVAYWTGKFRVSKERLAEAVEAVGHSAENVGAYLNGDALSYG